MFRFYLIGGGIPITVCGIRAAANIRNYGSHPSAPYCWMAWEPSFYGPPSFITFVNCMYFLSTFIQLKRHPECKYELKEPPEEQQKLAANENGEINHQDSMPLSLISTSALKNEHNFHSQLLGASLLCSCMSLCGCLGPWWSLCTILWTWFLASSLEPLV